MITSNTNHHLALYITVQSVDSLPNGLCVRLSVTKSRTGWCFAIHFTPYYPRLLIHKCL